MAFYVIPPSGSVGIDLLRKWTIARAKFLCDVYNCRDDHHALNQLMVNGIASNNYQYLIEGTAVDSITHFVLRLACAGDDAAEHTFMTAEIALFCYRLHTLNEAGLKRFMRHFHQLRKYFLSSADMLSTSVELADLCELLSVLNDSCIDWKSVIAGYLMSSVERHDCTQFQENLHIAIPFHYVQRLVAHRKVHLSNGMALMAPSQLPHILAAVFRKWLKYGILLAKIRQPSVTNGDDRFVQLFRECRMLVRGSSGHSWSGLQISALSGIRCDNIDNLAARFPPCMRHLHNCLRQKHRLKHMSRIIYTLFLKDVELPVDEALQFWSDEYGKPTAECVGSHGCQHSWRQRANRYIYSVRHLYGLVGKRANYRSYSCHTIQNQPWAVGEEACCPFKHLTRISLCQLLQPSSEVIQHKMCSLVDTGDYSGACRLHLNDLSIKSCSDIGGKACLSYSTVEQTVFEHATAEQTVSGHKDAMEIEETSDSGYDSAQSYQPMQQNNCTGISSSRNSELTDTGKSAQNTPLSSVSVAHHQCSHTAALPSKPNSRDICKHTVGSECDMAQRFNAPVDFYVSFNSLVTSLQSHAFC